MCKYKKQGFCPAFSKSSDYEKQRDTQNQNHKPRRLPFLRAARCRRIYTCAKQDLFRGKWREAPGERVNIVDSLLSKHDLIGMTEKEVTALLGENDNDSGYFSKDGRYVYYLGPERGLFSIDSEWLLIDFSDGKVSDFSLTTD